MENSISNIELLTQVLNEIEEQPAWRAKADKEMDYADGNQLDSDVLARQQELGIPPAVENIMGPTFDEIMGWEAKERRDWRVLPEGDGDAVAKAANFELNQAERRSGADRACSGAYEAQVKCGMGWVEVARESNPFKFKYRCEDVHRNEIWYDFLSRRDDLDDARWLLRRKWTDIDIAGLMFPKHKEVLKNSVAGWHGIDILQLTSDGGKDTGMYNAWDEERGWSIEEQEWRDREMQRICLFELWHRKFENVLVLKMPDGRVVEFDRNSPLHLDAVTLGIPLVQATVPKMYLTWFAGPHELWHGPSPYRHGKFPYVPFFGKREDRTRVPFGLARDMMFLQDEVNARVSKMQWGLSSVRVKRTEGVVIDDDTKFRDEIARPDSDVVLDADAVAAGGIFEVERDFTLSAQQYERLGAAGEAIRRAGRVSEVYGGHDTKGRSGSAITQLVEQSVQSLADINDNYQLARTLVGDMLLDMILEDMEGVQTEVTVKNPHSMTKETIVLNKPVEMDGMTLLDNDTMRTKLNVTLSDVPSTPSYRAQQLTVMQETFKSLPDDAMKAALPHLMPLLDLPEEAKEEIVKTLNNLLQAPSQEEIEQQIKDAVDAALIKAQVEEKNRKLDIEERYKTAQIGKIEEETMHTAVKAILDRIEGIYSGTQAAREIAATPGLAKVTDQVLDSAGFEDQDAPPIVAEPNSGVMPIGPMEPELGPELGPEVVENTSPMYPPRTQEQELEGPTPSLAPAPAPEPDEGIGEGIEAPGANSQV